MRKFVSEYLLGEAPTEPPILTLGEDAPFALPSHISFDGDMRVEGAVVVRSAFHGRLEARKIVVECDGAVTGAAVADEVEVLGNVSGEIVADKVVLRAAACVEADCTFDQFVIEEGAWFEGKTTRSGKTPV